MFSKDDGLVDALEDAPGKLARALAARTIWNAEAAALRAALVAHLEAKGYISFDANVTNYGRWHVGESHLFFVPAVRRGALSAFHGKTIRLVCTGSGRYTRGLMAGVVRVPKGLQQELVDKLEQNQKSIQKVKAESESQLKRYAPGAAM